MNSKTQFLKLCVLTVGFAAVLLASGCAGFFPGKDTVVSLSISPGGPFVMPQATQQFTATATFGNNNTGDVTDQVTWTSSQTGIATIDTSGLATGLALGTTTITAKSSNNITSSTILTVSNKTVTSLTLNPTSTTLSLSGVSGGQTVQFTATAAFSDGSFSTVTNQASWNSSVPTVASVNSTGLCSAVSIGSTSITASYGGQIATASVTVNQ